MSQIRTFFWHDAVKGRASTYWRRYLKKEKSSWRDFIVGNAGDIFARNLLSFFYPHATPINSKDAPRILSIGSIGHRLQQGDVLSGIGCKSTELPKIDPDSVFIHALRGPISYDVFKTAGYDVSGVSWLADPGLLIRKMVKPVEPRRGRVIFIPHYRERQFARDSMPKGMRLVDIDNDPLSVAKNIMRAELVYTSSLHGAVFSHALGRPVVLVEPQTEEPRLKYNDYYLAVGLGEPKMLSSIAEARYSGAPESPATLSVNVEQITFPDAELLVERGVIS